MAEKSVFPSAVPPTHHAPLPTAPGSGPGSYQEVPLSPPPQSFALATPHSFSSSADSQISPTALNPPSILASFILSLSEVADFQF